MATDIEARKTAIDRDLKKLEDEASYLLSIIDTMRQKLNDVKTDEDSRAFDEYMGEMLDKFEIINFN